MVHAIICCYLYMGDFPIDTFSLEDLKDGGLQRNQTYPRLLNGGWLLILVDNGYGIILVNDG